MNHNDNFIEINTNGGWLKKIPIDTPYDKPVRVWVDIKKEITPQDKDTYYNVFFACEPYVINRHDGILEWICSKWQQFDLVLAHDQRILQVCPNSHTFHWTSLLINENEDFQYIDKKFKISFICGGKTMCQGHLIRRWCWENQHLIKIPNVCLYSTQVRGNLPVFEGNIALSRDSKKEAFTDCMFHIAMENCIVPGYFSEKIVDCFAARSVPIYLGCPNISDFFDTRGIIIVSSVEEMFTRINTLTEEDFYSRQEYMEINRKIALDRYPINQAKGMGAMLLPLLNQRIPNRKEMLVKRVASCNSITDLLQKDILKTVLVFHNKKLYMDVAKMVKYTVYVSGDNLKKKNQEDYDFIRDCIDGLKNEQGMLIFDLAKEIHNLGTRKIDLVIGLTNSDHYDLLKPYLAKPTVFVNITEENSLMVKIQ